jgi:hypothetical protein
VESVCLLSGFWRADWSVMDACCEEVEWGWCRKQVVTALPQLWNASQKWGCPIWVGCVLSSQDTDPSDLEISCSPERWLEMTAYWEEHKIKVKRVISNKW